MKQYPFIIALLLACFPHSLVSTEKKKACNRELMNQFKLTGRHYAGSTEYSEICGWTMDNCCTIVDEMSITKLWNEYSKVVIRTHVEGVMHLYKSIFTLHNLITSLSLETISTHHIFERWVPFLKTTCSMKFEDDFDDDVYGLDGYEEFDTFNARHLEDKAKKLINTTDSLHKTAERYLQDQETVTKELEDELKDYFNKRNRAENDDVMGVERKLEDQGEKIEIDKKQMLGLDNIQSIKQSFTESIDHSIKSVHGLFNEKMKPIYDIKQKVEHELAHVNNDLIMAKSDPKVLKRVARKLDSKISRSDLFNEQLLNKFYHDTTTTEQAQAYLVTKKEKLERHLGAIMDFIKGMLDKEKDYLKSNVKVPLQNNYMSKLINTLLKTKANKFVKKKDLAIRKREMPKFPPIILPTHECSATHQSLYRKFYILNEAKLRYCDTVFNFIKDFQMDLFVDYLDNVRTAITRISNSKRTLYCGICDHSYQKYFDIDREQIYIERGFCRILVSEFKQYFEWKDIFFIEYIDKIFQLIECYEAPGNSIDFPYRTMITKFKRMSFFFKRCFTASESDNYFRYCHFICKHYKFHSMTEMLEGDVNLLKTIYTKIISFFRKHNIELPRDFVHEMKANYGRYIEYETDHHDPETSENIEAMVAPHTYGRKLKQEPVTSIYEQREPTVLLKDFTIVFIDENGLKPLRMDETLNFEIPLEKKIDNYIKLRGSEPIHHTTIHLSLFPPKVYNDFNNDFSFQFDDRELNFLEADQGFVKKTAVEKVQEKLNKKIVDSAEKPRHIVIVDEDKMSQAEKDGLPEMDFIFK